MRLVQQKNLTVVDLQPDTYVIVSVVIGNWDIRFERRFVLEVIRMRESSAFDASLIHSTPRSSAPGV